MRYLFTFCFSLLLLLNTYANSEVDSLKQLLQFSMHDTARVNILNSLAKQVRNSNSKEAFRYTELAYSLSLKSNYLPGIAVSSDILGVLYVNMGDYKKALTCHFRALTILTREHNPRGLAFTYNNIGSVYSHLKKYSQAESFYRKSLYLKLANGFYKEASSSYLNIGNIKLFQKDLDSSEFYYLKGYTNALKYKDNGNVTIGLMNLGEVSLDRKKTKLALRYYQRALPYIEASKNLYYACQANFAISKIYADLNQNALAEASFHKSLTIAKSQNIRPIELNIYKYLSQFYQKQKQFELAYQYLKDYTNLNDSIYNETSTQTANEFQTRFELQEKEDEIIQLRQEQAIAKANEERAVALRNSFIIVSILISIIAFSFLRSIIRKQRTNRLLKIKSDQIEWQREEIEKKNSLLDAYNKELQKENTVARYEVLKSKVNPHFLFNSMSTLSNLIIQDPLKAVDYVSKFSKVYRNILELSNQQLVSIETEIRFTSEYIHLQQIRFKEGLLFSCVVHNIHQKELIPPFTLQLLVENAIQHNQISKEKPLIIRVYSEEDSLIVSNNIQRVDRQNDSTRTGQQNIFERYQMIGLGSPSFYVDEDRYIAKLPLLKRTMAES